MVFINTLSAQMSLSADRTSAKLTCHSLNTHLRFIVTAMQPTPNVAADAGVGRLRRRQVLAREDLELPRRRAVHKAQHVPVQFMLAVQNMFWRLHSKHRQWAQERQ